MMASAFARQFWVHLGQTSNVAPGPRQACNNPGRYWITRSHHYDWNSAGGFFGFQSIVGNGRNDDVDFEPNQIGDEPREAVVFSIGVSVLDGDILSINPSEVRQSA
jgi:hypothetical protein